MDRRILKLQNCKMFSRVIARDSVCRWECSHQKIQLDEGGGARSRPLHTRRTLSQFWSLENPSHDGAGWVD